MHSFLQQVRPHQPVKATKCVHFSRVRPHVCPCPQAPCSITRLRRLFRVCTLWRTCSGCTCVPVVATRTAHTCLRLPGSLMCPPWLHPACSSRSASQSRSKELSTGTCQKWLGWCLGAYVPWALRPPESVCRRQNHGSQHNKGGTHRCTCKPDTGSCARWPNIIAALPSPTAGTHPQSWRTQIRAEQARAQPATIVGDPLLAGLLQSAASTHLVQGFVLIAAVAEGAHRAHLQVCKGRGRPKKDGSDQQPFIVNKDIGISGSGSSNLA